MALSDIARDAKRTSAPTAAALTVSMATGVGCDLRGFRGASRAGGISSGGRT